MSGYLNSFLIWAARNPYTFLFYVLAVLSPFFVVSALLSWKLSKCVHCAVKAAPPHLTLTIAASALQGSGEAGEGDEEEEGDGGESGQGQEGHLVMCCREMGGKKNLLSGGSHLSRFSTSTNFLVIL